MSLHQTPIFQFLATAIRHCVLHEKKSTKKLLICKITARKPFVNHSSTARMVFWVWISGRVGEMTLTSRRKLIHPTRRKCRSTAISFQPLGGARLGQRLNKHTVVLPSATHTHTGFACTGKMGVMGKLKSIEGLIHFSIQELR